MGLDIPRAVTSASNIYRRRLCPGSERLEAGLPEEDSPQSREGTLLHQYDASPELSRTFLKPQQQDLLRIAAQLDAQVFAAVEEQFAIAGEEYTEGRETELIALRKAEGETSGHCDRWRYYQTAGVLVIIDKKFGYNEVTPAAANDQLRTYAIAGAAEWQATTIVVAITQPRLPYEERITMAAYSLDDIRAAAKELEGIRATARNPEAPLVAGEEQCRYCKAKLICPAFRAKVSSIELPALTGTVAKREADAKVLLEACSDEQLDRMLLAIQLADFVKEPARDVARERVREGRMPGWQLGKEGTARKVVDPRRAVSQLVLTGKLTREEALDCCEMHLGPIEERVRQKTKCTWKEAREEVDAALASVIETTDKRPSLKRVAAHKLMSATER